ncbi:hypothetical protein GmHk_15G042811 [Glycine max]|nr:hypothetical protein GmHk_15G042811 [Glycine max]
MALFEMVVESYGSAMVARKCQLVAFALCTTAKPGAFHRNRPWDLGIAFRSHDLKIQHLEDKNPLEGVELSGGYWFTGSMLLACCFPLCNTS